MNADWVTRMEALVAKLERLTDNPEIVRLRAALQQIVTITRVSDRHGIRDIEIIAMKALEGK